MIARILSYIIIYAVGFYMGQKHERGDNATLTTLEHLNDLKDGATEKGGELLKKIQEK